MTSAMQQAVRELARLPGVRAAVWATEDDGLAAAAVATFDIDSDALAAFATSLLRRTRLAAEAAGYGRAEFLTLDATDGRVLVAAGQGTALVVLTDRDGGVGLARVAMRRAMGALA